MAYNETVNINVNANTTDLDGLEKSLESSEIKIKTLGGAINVLGGSVEVLAGGLALTGAVTEEQAEKFQSAAVGAIAFADGTKRVFEGYKELKEATKLATQAQKANNLAVLSNPYVAAAAAIAAVTVAVIALIKAQDDEEAQLKRLEVARERYNRQLSIEETNRLALVKASGADAVELAKEELKAAEDLLQAKNDAFVAAKIENQFSEETAEARLEAIDAEGKLEVAKQNLTNAINAQAEADKKASIEARNLRLEREGQLQVLQQLTDEIIDSLNLFGANNPLDEPLETLEEVGEEIENIIFFTEEQLKAFNKATEINEDQSFEARKQRMVDYYDDLIKQAESNSHQVQQLEKAKNKALAKFDEERKKQVTEAATATLSTASNLLGVLSENIDESNEEGFNKAKGYKIAETRVTSIQAAFEAYKGVVGVPIVGQILAPIAAAAALAAGQKAINDIKSSTFGDTSSPDFNAPGGTPSAPGAGGQQGGGIPQIPGFGTSGVQTLNAVVLSGDVTSAQAQDAAIRSRRRFGG